jgi:hypothetical protein
VITLQMKKGKKWEVGEVVHLRVVDISLRAPGRWRLTVDDITPLPGAEPTSYCCGSCGALEEAKPDGGLPDGWIRRDFEKGFYYICPELCPAEPVCRVCGCTTLRGCDDEGTPCSWAEPDLCTKCARERS